MHRQFKNDYLKSAKRDIADLAGRDKQGWLLFLYSIFIALFPLAEEPIDQELPSDLYVMF